MTFEKLLFYHVCFSGWKRPYFLQRPIGRSVSGCDASHICVHTCSKTDVCIYVYIRKHESLLHYI